MERYTEPTQSLPETFPQMLKPLLRVNYILGTFPYKIAFENGYMTLSKSSFHYYRALSTFFILASTVLALAIRMLQVLLSARELDSNGNPVPILSRMVELICSIHANFITLIILLLVFLKREVLAKYFLEVINYSNSLRGYTDNATVFSTVRKLYTLYTFLGLTAALTVALRCFSNPKIAPISLWLELSGFDEYISSEIMSIVSAFFVFYLAIVKFACLGNLEVVSCTQAICFSRTMENLMDYLEDQIEIWKRQYKGLLKCLVFWKI